MKEGKEKSGGSFLFGGTSHAALMLNLGREKPGPRFSSYDIGGNSFDVTCNSSVYMYQVVVSYMSPIPVLQWVCYGKSSTYSGNYCNRWG